MPVASESSTWKPVEETEENAYLSETPLSPAAPGETELLEYAADQGINRGMLNLIIRKMIAH